MDFELSRTIEKCAAQETEIERLRAALACMERVTAYQMNGRAHPLTCGRQSSHALLVPQWTGQRVQLRCLDCDYQQAFVPRFLCEPPAHLGIVAADPDLQDIDLDTGC